MISNNSSNNSNNSSNNNIDFIYYDHEEFVYQTMLTCIGNKRKLVKEIKNIVLELGNKLNREKLNIVDGFSGSSVVSRELSDICETLYVNDMEKYAYLMAKCFLLKPTIQQQNTIKEHINKMNQIIDEKKDLLEGIITTFYAPQNTYNIQKDERCFYTHENALIIDTLRNYIENEVETELKDYCIVPLLTKASIHTNTAGVFKGFYKDKNGIGKFGGEGENALSRIMKEIKLEMPLWNQINDYNCICSNQNINDFIKSLPNNIDVIYLDPPYNQHPYGSNYFMLNIIIDNVEPQDISKVSGIPKNWNKSHYNKRELAINSMKELLYYATQKSHYVLLSYNNEGIITEKDWIEIFGDYNVEKKEINYDTFKGCRNLKNRSNKVVEIMYIIAKKM
jgi:adenine-specific DNA-methyltransferase